VKPGACVDTGVDHVARVKCLAQASKKIAFMASSSR
jgi:hypothetical protein